jgi:hypothetical protein
MKAKDELKPLVKGCVVKMKSSSGMVGWGNVQCVSSVCEELGTLSLYGHNQHYKTYDVAEIVEHPDTRPAPADELLDEVSRFLKWLNTAENFSMKRSVNWLEKLYLKIESHLQEK